MAISSRSDIVDILIHILFLISAAGRVPAAIILCCFLTLPCLRAESEKEYIYLDGRPVAVDTSWTVENIIPAITSFTLGVNSPTPQLSNGNRHANLTLGRTVTLNWASQNAQSCGVWYRDGSGGSGGQWPTGWAQWTNNAVNGSQNWGSDVTGSGLQFQLRCVSYSGHETSAEVSMNVYPLPASPHTVAPASQDRSGSFALSGTRSGVTSGFTDQCGYELAKYDGASRNSGRTIVAGQYPAPANGAWSGTLSANQPVGDFYSTVSFCLNGDGVYGIVEQPVAIKDVQACRQQCATGMQMCQAQAGGCVNQCAAQIPNCAAIPSLCAQAIQSCVAQCQSQTAAVCPAQYNQCMAGCQ